MKSKLRAWFILLVSGALFLAPRIAAYADGYPCNGGPGC